MTIKFPLFEVVPALTLTKLNVGISKVLNKDSIERILKSYIEKIMSHEVLKVEEARVMIDWHSHLQQHDKLNFSKYLSNYLEVQPDLIALIC